MALTITDLFTPLTSDQIRTKMVNELKVLNIPADKWRTGGALSTMLTVTAIILSMFSNIIAQLIQWFFLPTASGLGLQLLALYLYGVTVPQATFASGNVTLTNTGGGVYSYGIGQFTVQNSTTGMTYTNTAAFTLNSGTPASPSTATFGVQATTAGSVGNAIAGAVNVLVTVLVNVTVANAAALIGIDAPDDNGVRALCMAKVGASGVRGVRTAYKYAILIATNTVSGAPVNINRSALSPSTRTGQITVTIASPSGTVDPNDLAGVANSIETVARPECVSVITQAATAIPYTQNVSLFFKAPPGVDLNAVQTAVNNAIAAYIANYKIGGETDPTNTAFTGFIGSGIYGVAGQAGSTVGATLVSGSGAANMALLPGQVPSNSVTSIIRMEAA